MCATQRVTASPIYQIKVTLAGSKPPIWRRIQVRGDITLGKLHDILQVAMGWEDYHLHQFSVGRTYYGVPHPDFGFEVRDERRVKLNQIAPGEGFKFVYEYDFGDGWEHILLVEKGKFSVVFNKIPAKISKQPVDPMKAMMDSLAYIDEIKTLMEKFVLDSGKQNPNVVITPEIKKRKGTENFKENQEILLENLVISLEGDLKEIVQFLLKMHKDNTLKLNPGPGINNVVNNK